MVVVFYFVISFCVHIECVDCFDVIGVEVSFFFFRFFL